MLNALETNRRTDKAQAEANRARSVLRQNIEYIKSYLDPHPPSEDKANLMKKIEEIDKWLISNKKELTNDIRNKFESIEEDAKKMLIKYPKVE
uniref:Uncharacterized protein n=1 Tax=Panagrolaimus sp. JU765 TaxID=591449 RepID=A0AC34RS03_9BILA